MVVEVEGRARVLCFHRVEFVVNHGGCGGKGRVFVLVGDGFGAVGCGVDGRSL